ncbi:MAG TPA: carboxypeptidase regulatory-like domain-containing protein [Mucilaginibacter sp.]
MPKTLLLLIALLPLTVFSQVTITGRVISHADSKPVVAASVFLSNATNGDHSANDGSFELQKVKPGQYELVVSIVGFETYKQSVVVGNTAIKVPDIVLTPRTFALNAVTIVAKKKKDPNISRYIEQFKKEFLGESKFSADCRLLNPELLDIAFDADSNRLTASSVDFLVIENKALGYKVKYLLEDFLFDQSHPGTTLLSYKGSVLFEEMTGTPEEQKEWEKNRATAYEGSQMHFFRAVIKNQIKEEGFRVFRLPPKSFSIYQNVLHVDKFFITNVKHQSQLIMAPDKQGIYTMFGNHDMLYIGYNKDRRFRSGSYFPLSGNGNTTLVFNADNVLFDNNGSPVNPKTFTLNGDWGRRGVSSLLPVDYKYPFEVAPGAETSEINSIAAKLKLFTDSVKTEKAYLHFDKPFYATGDTIYFKAYVTAGGQHQLSGVSTVLHVELIGPDNRIAASILPQLNNGLGWGDFALPDTLKPGAYHIRAYTNWMRNSAAPDFFDHEILIGAVVSKGIPEAAVRPNKQNQPMAAVAGSKTDVQFLPEGGSLIAGNYSKIAFKAVAPDGTGSNIKGTITDDTGGQVCSFETSHLGMGVFNIVAHQGRTYKANITYADGSTGAVDLPKAVNAGYTFNLSNVADTIRLRITAGSSSNIDKLSLIAQSGGVVYYAAESTPGSRFFSAVIPANKFPTGIAQFTLFGPSGEPLNERLAFINNDADQLKLKVVAGNTYKPRQKVNMTLNTLGANDKPAAGSFSVAVTDEINVPADENDETTILSNLLLTSDLRGTVEQPNYYFADVNDKTRADLDLLMLTQGYRSFIWKQVLDGANLPVKYQSEKTLVISGTVKRNGKIVPGAKIKLFTIAAGGLMRDTLTDSNGRFAFNNLEFADNTKFVVQSRVEKGQDDVTLDLDTLSPPTIDLKRTGKDRRFVAKKADTAAYMLNQRRFYEEQQKYGINKTSIVLKEVKVEDKKPMPIPHSQNLNGSGQADQVLTAKDIERFICGRLKDCLQGVLRGVKFRSDGTPTWDGQYIKIPVMIDGTIVESDEFDDIRPDDVEGIEFIYGPRYGAIYGGIAADGLIMITTKPARRTDNIHYRYAPGVVTYKPQGFYKARKFYSPQYDNPKTNQKMADLRSTIYWNPNIITDKDGKASFSYFNADGKGTYRVVIEGIDDDGNLGRQVYRYKVE